MNDNKEYTIEELVVALINNSAIGTIDPTLALAKHKDIKKALYPAYQNYGPKNEYFEKTIHKCIIEIYINEDIKKIREISKFVSWMKRVYTNYLIRQTKEIRERDAEIRQSTEKEIEEVKERNLGECHRWAITLALTEDNLSNISLLIYYRILLDIDHDGKGVNDKDIAKCLSLSPEAYRKRVHDMKVRIQKTALSVNSATFNSMSEELQNKAEFYESHIISNTFWETIITLYKELLSKTEWGPAIKALIEKEEQEIRDNIPNMVPFAYRGLQESAHSILKNDIAYWEDELDKDSAEYEIYLENAELYEDDPEYPDIFEEQDEDEDYILKQEQDKVKGMVKITNYFNMKFGLIRDKL